MRKPKTKPGNARTPRSKPPRPNALSALSPSEAEDLRRRTSLADALQGEGDAEAALAVLEGVSAAQAKRPEHRARRATLLAQFEEDSARLAEAERLFRKLLSDGFYSPQIYANFASLLITLEKYDKAIPMLQSAIEAKPDLESAFTDLLSLYQQRGAWAEAERYLSQALERNPDSDLARKHCGQLRLGIGDYAQGWVDYAERLERSTAAAPPAFLPDGLPYWDGLDRRLEPTLLWREQGVGEQILFSSLAQEFAAGGAALGLVADPRMASLLRRSLPDVAVIADEEGVDADLSVYRRHGPAGALGPALRWDAECFPRPAKPFLRSCPELGRSMSDWLRSLGPEPKIGISWRSKNKRIGDRKSMPIEHWGPILSIPGVRFVDLQYGPSEEDRKRAASMFGVEISSHPTLDRMNDFEGMAALIDALDGVATISNAAAHLSGALGQNTFLMLSKAHFWFWSYRPEVPCPWYAKVECFRRCDPGDKPSGWRTVAETVADRLQSHLRSLPQ